MAGEAKTTAFMLGTATIMLGAMADLMSLNDNHSVGLVKNVTVKTTPGFTELTQGVKNSPVFSVQTQNDSDVTGEMYEYTSKNLSYSAGLDGSSVKATTVKNTVKTAVVAPVDPAPLGAAAIPMDDTAGFAAGDTVFVTPPGTENVMVRNIANIDAATKTLTLNLGLPFAVPVGTVIQKVNVVPVGSTDDQPYLAAKIVGKLANGDMVAILLPKVRITSGLSLAFKTDNFDNMPLQLKVYEQVASDPYYQMFQKVGPMQKPAKAMLLAAG
jgi:hypothetical protein